VTAHAIAGESYIAREEGSSTRGVAERYLARLGVTLTPAMELGSTEAIREAVAAGLGWRWCRVTRSWRGIDGSSPRGSPAPAGRGIC